MPLPAARLERVFIERRDLAHRFVLAGRMISVPKPFPVEFRRDVVAVARKGRAPLSQIARDFGISGSCLHRWLKLADIYAYGVLNRHLIP
jgi:transposase-like protein